MNNPLAGTDPTGYARECDASGVLCYEPPKDKNSICKLSSSECNATGWSSRPSKESTGNNGANASPQNNTPPESATDIESEESKDDDFGTSGKWSSASHHEDTSEPTINDSRRTETWDPVSNKRIDKLHPDIRDDVTDFINNVEDELGITLRVT